jgi:hypothetical protein
VYFVSYRDPVPGVAFVVRVPPLPFLATLHLVIPSYFEIYSPYQAQKLKTIEEVLHMQGSSSSSRWTADDKIRIVMESLTTNITLAKLCRKYNLKTRIYKLVDQELSPLKIGTTATASQSM